MDLVNALITNNRRMSEEHIAFIVKEVVKVRLKQSSNTLHVF